MLPGEPTSALLNDLNAAFTPTALSCEIVPARPTRLSNVTPVVDAANETPAIDAPLLLKMLTASAVLLRPTLLPP